MFIPFIKGQGTDEQQRKWLSLARTMQIIGCYAQTELGHGSNVQGLETTATFDPQTDEFIIHSPTLTSSKVSRMTGDRYLLKIFLFHLTKWLKNLCFYFKMVFLYFVRCCFQGHPFSSVLCFLPLFLFQNLFNLVLNLLLIL